MPRWDFREMQDSQKWHEPNEGEFFRESPIAALVREAVQNSLDASVAGGRVRLRFLISDTNQALKPDQARVWFEGLDEHLQARDLPTVLSDRTSVPFLCFEDFGTTGLTGNPIANRPPRDQNEKNNFFFFWRALGSTGKDSSERGSWGIGKSTYQYVSAIQTFIGLTVRSDDRRALLMGEAWLGPHDLGDVRFDSFGAFGEFKGEPGHDRHFVTPAESAPCLHKFRTDFCLERKEEPGFSCVIPMPFDLHERPEAIETLPDDLVDAAIRHFSVPLLADRLRIDIVRGGQPIILQDKNSLLEAVDKLKGDETNSVSRKDELRTAVELAAWALSSEANVNRVTLLNKATRDGCGWQHLEEPEGKLDDLRTTYLSGKPIAIRVPVTVRFRDARDNAACSFDVFLQSTLLKKPVVQYVRHDLGISDIRGGPSGSVAALVNVENNALASLLRAAENPAHTTWRREARKVDRLKREYLGGEERIKLVIEAPKVLLGRLLANTGKQDFDLLADYFPVPTSSAIHRKKRQGPTSGKEETDPPDETNKSEKPLLFTALPDGFTFTRIPSVPLKSTKFAFKVAFDIADGNAFKQWEKFDFQIGKNGIRCDCTGGSKKIKDNEIVATIRSDDFCLTVRGFPLERDVAVETPRWLSDKNVSGIDAEED